MTEFLHAFLERAGLYMPFLLTGLKMTIVVTLGSLAVSTVLGAVWAVIRYMEIPVLSPMVAALINMLRSIPILVQLYFIYFVAPSVGLSLTALQAAIIGIGVGYSVYHAESYRAALKAVERGQIEAAKSIGMNWWLMLRRVIIPQAVPIALPSWGNLAVMMLKDSSLASTITVTELAFQGRVLASSTYDNSTIYILVSLLYMVICLPLLLLVSKLEIRSRPNS